MNMKSDRALVLQCKQELPYQTRAFEYLVDRYKDRVFTKILGMVRNRTEAEDIAQDVFIKVFQAIPRFREESTFSTWLYSITVNVCLNHIDKSKRRPGWWLSEDDSDLDPDLYEDVVLFERVTARLENEETSSRIKRALGALSDEEQQLIRLRYFDERDQAAIAEELGIGLSAAKMRLKQERVRTLKDEPVELHVLQHCRIRIPTNCRTPQSFGIAKASGTQFRTNEPQYPLFCLSSADFPEYRD